LRLRRVDFAADWPGHAGGKRSATQEATGDQEEGAAKEDAGIVPLGIPMLAGPGAISSVMVLVGPVPGFFHWQMGAILGRCGDCPGELLGAGWAGGVRAVLGRRDSILVRIYGLLLVALAMQFFVNG